jgi:hypothetical protein
MPRASHTLRLAPSVQTWHAEIGGHAARLLRLALAATRAGRRARDDRLDEAAADGLVDDLIGGDVHLEQRHGALDVHADGPG